MPQQIDLPVELALRNVVGNYGQFVRGGGTPAAFGAHLQSLAAGQPYQFTVGGQPITGETLVNAANELYPGWTTSPDLVNAASSLLGRTFQPTGTVAAPAPTPQPTPQPPQPPPQPERPPQIFGGPVGRGPGEGGIVSGGMTPDQERLLTLTLHMLRNEPLSGSARDIQRGVAGIMEREREEVGSAEPTPVEQQFLSGLGGGTPGEDVDLRTLPGAREREQYMNYLLDKQKERLTQQFAGRGMSLSTGLGSRIADVAGELTMQNALKAWEDRQAALGQGLRATQEAISRATGRGTRQIEALQGERANLMRLAGMGAEMLGGGASRAYADYARSLERQHELNLVSLAANRALISGALTAGAYFFLDPITRAITRLFAGQQPPPGASVYTIGSNGALDQVYDATSGQVGPAFAGSFDPDAGIFPWDTFNP